MSVCCECCVLSGRGLCDELITGPEESYRLWCVVVCNLETSRMRRPWPTGGYRAKNNKPLKSFLCKVHSVSVKQNEWQAVPLCNSSSNLYTSCLSRPTLILTLWSMYNVLMNLLSRQSMPPSLISALIRQKASHHVGQMPSAYLLSMNTIIHHVQSVFRYYSQHRSCIPSSSFSSESILIFSNHVLNFL